MHNFSAPFVSASTLAREARTGWPENPRLAYTVPEEDKDVGALVSATTGRVLTAVYDACAARLRGVLAARGADRAAIDRWTRGAAAENMARGLTVGDDGYLSVLGVSDGTRTPLGPLGAGWRAATGGAPIAPLPDHLRGFHVTLFGPPDSAKLAVNAMNAASRALPGEPPLVAQLVADAQIVPKWGADDEDSKTPLFGDLAAAAAHLNACFDRSLETTDAASGKHYAIAPADPAAGVFPSLPIKRIPGLDLPCLSVTIADPLADGGSDTVPLHMLDLVAHVVANATRPEALTFYIPKLENEEEAAYVAALIGAVESAIVDLGVAPDYVPGTIRVILVLENPRAVFRVHEMMDALYPYFAGASLGWHDYLASTARVFAHDPQYSIPVKADPDIVIKHIKESHVMLAEVVGSRGGLKIGGMYGILPSSRELTDASMQVTLIGYVRDVVTQLKRGLDGFWVAHPDFVRIGIAIVHAFRTGALNDLIAALILDPAAAAELVAFVAGPDIDGLTVDDPKYPRALLAADVGVSNIVANSDESELRYNIFQALQYLADWLVGNGCVALPTTVRGVAVRVMDDLATTERSRWEVWAELFHGRVDVFDYLRLVEEELNIIRRNKTAGKAVQVTWDRAAKWYPVAANILLLLTLPTSDGSIIEFAPRLLLPFTLRSVRAAADPWAAATALEPAKYALPRPVRYWRAVFTALAHPAAATALAHAAAPPSAHALAAYLAAHPMSLDDVVYAADFHGDIGSIRYAAAHEQAEQGGVIGSGVESDLVAGTVAYAAKYGFKFLVSAAGRSGADLLAELTARLESSTPAAELAEAVHQLIVIASRRLGDAPPPAAVLADIAAAHGVAAAAYACLGRTSGIAEPPTAAAESMLKHSVGTVVASRGDLAWRAPLSEVVSAATVVGGAAVDAQTSLFQLASMSKTVGTALALEYFVGNGAASLPNVVPVLGTGLETPVAAMLAAAGSPFVLAVDADAPGACDAWVDQLTLSHLVDHSGLGQPYVFGLPEWAAASGNPVGLMDGSTAGAVEAGYVPIKVGKAPGSAFGYSGGAFVLLQHLLEAFSGVGIVELMGAWLPELGLDPQRDLVFGDIDAVLAPGCVAVAGVRDTGDEVPRLHFPALAAGAWGTPSSMLAFIAVLAQAYASPGAEYPLSHDTAVRMLGLPLDRGAVAFQNAKAGRGLFVVEAGPNKVMIHQASNDGYTGMYAVVFGGPDAGSGFCTVSTGDLAGVFANVAMARHVLRSLAWTGVDVDAFVPLDSFDATPWPPHQIVNQAYRQLLFAAFAPALPETIVRPPGTPLRPLDAADVASGATLVAATSEAFAPATNLVSPLAPVFDPEAFGLQGKIMDSWETARHRSYPPHAGYDTAEYAVTKDTAPVAYVCVSTVFHDGNHAQEASVEYQAPGSDEWLPLLPRIPLAGHTEHWYALAAPSAPVAAFKVYNYPDGGITRLGLYPPGTTGLPAGLAPGAPVVVRSDAPIPRVVPVTHHMAAAFRAQAAGVASRGGVVADAASLAGGGRVVAASNEHYGPAVAALAAYPPMGMFDGMESARSRVAGHVDWLEIEVAEPTRIGAVVLDFAFFRNNNPWRVTVKALAPGADAADPAAWRPLVDRLLTKEYAGNVLVVRASDLASAATAMAWASPIARVKVIAEPDGGINRVRLLRAPPVSKL